jgi:hypothetical protein
MTSEKSYSTEARLAALVARVAALEATYPQVRNVWAPGNTATAAGLTNIAAYTIQPGDTAVLSIHEVEIWGNGQQGSVGNRQTLEFAVKLGGTTASTVTFGTTSLPDTSAVFRYRVKVRCICQSTGSSGTFTSFVEAVVNQFNANIAIGNNNENIATSSESSSTFTQDTTSPFDLGCSVAWGATTGAPTLTSQVARATRLA